MLRNRNKSSIAENKWNKRTRTTIIICFSCVLLGWLLLGINHWLCFIDDTMIISAFSILSNVISAGMIVMTAIQINKSVDSEYLKNKPQLKIFVFTSTDTHVNPENGKVVINKKGKYHYTFCTNLGEKNRSFQFYGICRKDDYSKIILPQKKGKYGDLFWINDQALKYVYPYLKKPDSQPEWNFENLDPGEVSKRYRLNITEAEEKLKRTSDLEDFYILYVDSTGYIFKELIHF